MLARGLLFPVRGILFLLLAPGRQWCVLQGPYARWTPVASSRKRAAQAVLVVLKHLLPARRVLTAIMVAVDIAAVAHA